MKQMDHSAMGHSMQDSVVVDHSMMDHSAMGKAGMDPSAMGHTMADGSAMQMTADGIHMMAGIPDWLYYSSIIFIMMISVMLFELIRRRGGIFPAAKKHDLTQFSPVLSFFKSRAVQTTIQIIIVSLFGLILFAGFYGNQHPGENIAPTLTWNIWWVGLIFVILFFGKMWCYMCPWDAVTSWVRRIKIFGIDNKEPFNLNLKWPKALKNIYPAAIFFILLTWLELGFQVTMSPEKTAFLGLMMFTLVFIPGLIFEKKSFCRYGCLVGRISGLYAMFSPIELRNRDQKMCDSCKTYDCFTGNENGYACPTGQNLKTMNTNTYCIMCAECFRTCKKDNVAVNLRPFSHDLIAAERPRKDEAYLALILFALTAFHGLTMTPNWKILIRALQDRFIIGELTAFTVGMSVSLVIPLVVYYGFVWLSRLMSGEKTLSVNSLFIKYSYGVIPIALFYHIAHNVEHFVMESQKLVVLSSDPLGYGWNLFGTANIKTASLFSLGSIWYIQVILIIAGHLFGLYVSHKHSYALFKETGKAVRSQLPMILMMVLFSVLSLWLVAQPMEMRTAM